MKTIIAGGRDYELTAEDCARLTELEISEVVCGCARGADTGGRTWAETLGIPVALFPADWPRLGAAAGPIRNQRMADYADALVAFPGGHGTADMVRRAKAKGLVVHDWRA